MVDAADDLARARQVAAQALLERLLAVGPEGETVAEAAEVLAEVAVGAAAVELERAYHQRRRDGC